MKRAMILFLLIGAGGVTFGETILICHAQSVPAALETGFQSNLRNSMVEKVFDFYFNRGDIAFDTTFPLDKGPPSATWLGSQSLRYGADRVVSLQVYWKATSDGKAALDHLDYQVLTSAGRVDLEGSLSAPLTCGAPDEEQVIEDLGNNVIQALKS